MSKSNINIVVLLIISYLIIEKSYSQDTLIVDDVFIWKPNSEEITADGYKLLDSIYSNTIYNHYDSIHVHVTEYRKKVESQHFFNHRSKSISDYFLSLNPQLYLKNSGNCKFYNDKFKESEAYKNTPFFYPYKVTFVFW